jgi:hypothetical protein
VRLVGACGPDTGYGLLGLGDGEGTPMAPAWSSPCAPVRGFYAIDGGGIANEPGVVQDLAPDTREGTFSGHRHDGVDLVGAGGSIIADASRPAVPARDLWSPARRCREERR